MKMNWKIFPNFEMNLTKLPYEKNDTYRKIASKIYLIRGMKVMLDRDLAELYAVETRRLKEQVRRNIERFRPVRLAFSH